VGSSDPIGQNVEAIDLERRARARSVCTIQLLYVHVIDSRQEVGVRYTSSISNFDHVVRTGVKVDLDLLSIGVGRPSGCRDGPIALLGIGVGVLDVNCGTARIGAVIAARPEVEGGRSTIGTAVYASESKDALGDHLGLIARGAVARGRIDTTIR